MKIKLWGVALALILIFIAGIFTFYSGSDNSPPEGEASQHPTQINPTLNDLFKSLLKIDPNLDVSPLYYRVDLNNDDVEEYIAVLNNNLFCGSLGCMHAIFVKEDNRWRVTNVIYAHSWALEQSQTRGYKDILINGERRWIWTGPEYSLDKTS
jgi:hypothetical protein